LLRASRRCPRWRD